MGTYTIINYSGTTPFIITYLYTKPYYLFTIRMSRAYCDKESNVYLLTGFWVMFYAPTAVEVKSGMGWILYIAILVTTITEDKS